MSRQHRHQMLLSLRLPSHRVKKSILLNLCLIDNNNFSDFETALGLYTHIFGANRTQYVALCEVMSLLPGPNPGSPHPDIKGLPNQW